MAYICNASNVDHGINITFSFDHGINITFSLDYLFIYSELVLNI